MTLRWWLWFAILAGGDALHAGTIRTQDISAETITTVHSGDTLLFQLFTWNFGRNTERFNVPALPADLNFVLVTSPLDAAGEFAATLESEDRSVTAAIGEVQFSRGFFTSSGYSGEVSTLQGYLHLAPLLSQSLFEAGSIVIALENLGPDLEIGLSPYVLRQNMFVSVSVGRLSVGALPGWVELEEPQKQLRSSVFGAGESLPGVAETPEPDSRGLSVAGGLILCALSVLLRQFSRRRGQTARPRKISRLHPVIHSVNIYMADRNPPLEPPQIHNGVTQSTE
jgi:hypothetical protein